MLRESEIEIVHFYNGPGQRGSYRVIHLPTGLFVEGRRREAASHQLAQYLLGQIRDKVTRTCVLRDVSGNAFYPCLPLSPAIIAWNGGTVRRIAQAIYDDRGFDRMPVLAEALEEAGCTDPELLDHLRQPGPHSRGCWAINALIGRS
jgi:hypothetical protein